MNYKTLTELEAIQVFNGRHSGFRECCIQYFIRDWFPGWSDRRSKEHDRLLEGAGIKSPGYVLCPDCIKARRVAPIRLCDSDCGLKCQKIDREKKITLGRVFYPVDTEWSERIFISQPSKTYSKNAAQKYK